MAKRNEPDDLIKIMGGLDEADPRAAILVGASLLEFTLENLLEAGLRPSSSRAKRDALFSFNGILGTFSSKITMAYYVKLIGPRTRRDLDLVRTIRNECAHNMNPVTFDTMGISSRCRELRTSVKAPVTPKRIFLESVASLVVHFMTKAQVLGTPLTSHKAFEYIDE